MWTMDTSPPLILALPGNEPFAQALSAHLVAHDDPVVGSVDVHRFADGEAVVHVPRNVAARDVALVCTLDRPDAKLLPLLFAARAARELGAHRVGLVAPYLPYLRRDRRFLPGEAVSAGALARLLGEVFDWTATVDTHAQDVLDLPGCRKLSCVVADAAPCVADWIASHVHAPLLVTADGEEAPWVQVMAGRTRMPSVAAEALRFGDCDTRVNIPGLARWRHRTPVLVDDIISPSPVTIATITHLLDAGMAPPVCVGVHAVFSDDAAALLSAAGAARLVTSNTVAHPTNAIDLSSTLASAVLTADLSRATHEVRGCGPDWCDASGARGDGSSSTGCALSNLYVG